MKKPVPSPVLVVPGHREAGASRQDASHSKAEPIRLNFRFYTAMKPQRVYPLRVELPRGVAAKGSGSAAPLVVRPTIPGALVVPPEQTLDLNPAGESVTFHVTPLAKGRLKDAKVDVTHSGRLVERVGMRMIGKTQRLTWILLLLTLIIPAVMLYYTSIAPLEGEVPRLAPGDAALQRRTQPPGANGGERAAERQGDEAKAAVAEPVAKMKVGTKGEVLQYRISKSIRPNSPQIRWVNEGTTPYVVTDHPTDALEWVAWTSGYLYEGLCAGRDLFYPSFLCAVALFSLTLFSLISHRATRGFIRRKGIRLADPALSGSPRFTSQDEPATVVEVVN
jgi:hypothetical protein